MSPWLHGSLRNGDTPPPGLATNIAAMLEGNPYKDTSSVELEQLLRPIRNENTTDNHGHRGGPAAAQIGVVMCRWPLHLARFNLSSLNESLCQLTGSVNTLGSTTVSPSLKLSQVGVVL